MKIIKRTEERGALMIEAIALLGLMTMMSPMVVRQTADRTSEMEEVAVAGQMKTLKDAVASYIDANYAEIAAAADWTADGTDAASKTLELADIRPYLPASFVQKDGATEVITNKLVEDYKIALRRERPCTVVTPGDKCDRFRVTGLVSSTGTAEMDDRRIARIATMVGADGGYIRSKAAAAAFSGAGADPALEQKRVIGAQGVWEIENVDKFFPTNGPGTGRVVATTTYTSGVRTDFLYRNKIIGFPEGNSMFTDLDMSGQGKKNSEVRGAGGLEIVGGKLLVVAKGAPPNQPNTLDVKASDDVLFGVASDGNIRGRKGGVIQEGDAKLSVDATDSRLIKGGSGAIVAGAEVKLYQGADSTIDVMGSEVRLLQQGTKVSLTGDLAEITSKNVVTTATTGDITTTADAGNIFLSAARKMEMLGSNIDAISDTTILLDAVNDINVTSTDGNAIVGAVNVDFQADKLLSGDADNINMFSTEKSSFGIGTDANLVTASNLTAGLNVFSGLIEALKPGGVLKNEVKSEIVGGLSVQKNLNVTNDSGVVLGTLRSSTDNNRGELQFVNTKSGAAVKSAVIAGGFGSNANEISFYEEGKDTAIVTVDATRGGIQAGYLETRRIRDKSDNYVSAITGGFEAIEYNDDGTLDTKKTVAMAATNVITDQIRMGSAVDSIVGPYDERGNVATGRSTEEGKYKHYRVDPAYVSVMNDIKLTSRGGARLSEMMPNYINKGIYMLSNSYAAGPWPCLPSTGTKGQGNCTFDIPRLRNESGSAVLTGGWEHDCTTMTAYLVPPASCVENPHYIRVNYYSATDYKSCDDSKLCLTHPYMGAVPAPGRSVTVSGEKLAGYDEGNCPDGYVPVMTLTPTSFDVGRVNFINMTDSVSHIPGGNPDLYGPDDFDAAYNFDFQDYSQDPKNAPRSIYQPATMVRIVAVGVDATGNELGTGKNQKLHGWKVAMGTVTPKETTGTTGSHPYIWNMGGIFNGRMTVTAHTYCYFNPSRFRFPNMQLRGNVLEAMDNPNIEKMKD